MAWFKVDDQLAFHPKTAAAGNAAMGLWVRAGSYASAHLTDGFIASAIALAMANECDADALVTVGLWDRVEGGYQFHGWDEWQPDAEDEKRRREERSEKRRIAGRKGAAARWGNRDAPEGDGTAIASGMASAMANGCDRNGKPMPPTPTPLSSKEERGPAPTTSSRKKSSRPIPEDWAPSNSHKTKAETELIDLDHEAQMFINDAHAKDKRFANWDRAFTNWLSRDWVKRTSATIDPLKDW